MRVEYSWCEDYFTMNSHNIVIRKNLKEYSIEIEIQALINKNFIKFYEVKFSGSDNKALLSHLKTLG